MTEKETIEQWQRILNESSRYQIEDNETFLDLCHYTGERFEEICSRVLAFFLNPNGKHGFSTLWFDALCKTINDQYKKQQSDKKIESIDFEDSSKMEITTEESTNYADITNKRIDIVLKTPTLVIGIENKINAQLYNDLDQYKQHISNKYEKTNNTLVVLTARTLNQDESEKANKSEFIVIKYDDLFNNVTTWLGKYVAKCDQKYLSFMLDFIQTVKNRANIMEETEFDKFFAKNQEKIEDLKTKYKDWQGRLWTKQVEKMSNFFPKMGKEFWKKWIVGDNGWMLRGPLFSDKNDKRIRIGIQSHFEFDAQTMNPVGLFCITILTWDAKSWEKFENKVTERYGKNTNNSGPQKHVELPTIEQKNFDNEESFHKEIIDKLKECYDFLKEITDNIDK